MVGWHLESFRSKKYDREAQYCVRQGYSSVCDSMEAASQGKRMFVLIGNARADDCVLMPIKTPRRHAIEQRREAVPDAFGDALGGLSTVECIMFLCCY